MFRVPSKSLGKLANDGLTNCCRSFSTTEWKSAKPYKQIPGPDTMTMIMRNAPGGKYYGKEWAQVQRDMVNEYGPIVKVPRMLSIGEKVMISDPDDFEHLFRTEGQYPNRRLFLTNEHYRREICPEKFNYSTGLLAVGEAWGKMRSAVNPVMMKPIAINQYIPQSDIIAIEFVERIKQIRDENLEMPANFLFEINKWAMETVSNIAFDTRLNGLGRKKGDPNSRSSKFVEAVDGYFRSSFALEMKPSLWTYIATPEYKRCMKILETLSDIGISYIEEADARFKKHPSSASGREACVLEKLLNIDRSYGLLMGIDMILAGVDTTSAAVTNFMYVLAKNPDKQEKLRQEIFTIPVDEYGNLTPKSFKNTKYFRACFKELLRMIPVAAGNSRDAGRDIELRGYHIPKGTCVTMTVSLPPLDPKYIKYPNRFIPERFLAPSEPGARPDLKVVHPFVYLPFGFGPRACIGKRIGEMEVAVLMTRILKNFRIEYDYGPLKFRSAIVNSATTDLKFRMIDLGSTY